MQTYIRKLIHYRFIGTIMLFLIFLLALNACTTLPPNDPNNICNIFTQYHKWYWEAKDSEKRWGVPVYTQMAIIHQESSFNAKAKPARRKLLWILPWKRPSSSYGYTQAKNETWKNYLRSSGKRKADRDEFGDATDFIGWYGYTVNKRLGIKKYDAFHLYLAYHEGIGGYTNKSYQKKPWLIGIAKKVSAKAWVYHRQLQSCEANLPKKHWWNI